MIPNMIGFVNWLLRYNTMLRTFQMPLVHVLYEIYFISICYFTFINFTRTVPTKKSTAHAVRWNIVKKQPKTNSRTNSVDPDQSASTEEIWSGSTKFVHTRITKYIQWGTKY